MNRALPTLAFAPIDDRARNGECWEVRAPGQPASVAMYLERGWRFANGRRLDFEPTEYLRRGS